MKNCGWKCGRKTKNHAGICDQSWNASATLRKWGEADYQAWCGKERQIKGRLSRETSKLLLEKARQPKAANLLTICPKPSSGGIDLGYRDGLRIAGLWRRETGLSRS
jgi:hypothetical protein